MYYFLCCYHKITILAVSNNKDKQKQYPTPVMHYHVLHENHDLHTVS